MKILIGTDTYPPTVNGAAQFSQRLARGLTARGHEVHVICPSPTGPAGFLIGSDQVRVHRLSSMGNPRYATNRLASPAAVNRRVSRILDEVAPDAVHVQDHFLLGRVLLSQARRRDITSVATNHLMPENFLDHVPCPAPLHKTAARLLWRDLARVYRQAGVVTSPTRRAVELLEDATGLRAVAVSNGIDITPYAQAASGKTPRAVPTVLFVGRLDREKRVDDLLRAMARLPREVPGRLEIAGSGPQRAEWEALAAQLGLTAERVRFLGFVPDDELLAAYGRADVFAMPGTAELQSLATLEALAAATPVLAANAMALPHVVEHGRNGYLHRPGDVADMSVHLTTLLRNPALRERMGARSQQIAAEHSMERTLRRFEDLYTLRMPRDTQPQLQSLST